MACARTTNPRVRQTAADPPGRVLPLPRHFLVQRIQARIINVVCGPKCLFEKWVHVDRVMIEVSVHHGGGYSASTSVLHACALECGQGQHLGSRHSTPGCANKSQGVCTFCAGLVLRPETPRALEDATDAGGPLMRSALKARLPGPGRTPEPVRIRTLKVLEREQLRRYCTGSAIVLIPNARSGEAAILDLGRMIPVSIGALSPVTRGVYGPLKRDMWEYAVNSALRRGLRPGTSLFWPSSPGNIALVLDRVEISRVDPWPWPVV